MTDLETPPRRKNLYAWTIGTVLAVGLVLAAVAAAGGGASWMATGFGWGMMRGSGGMGMHPQGMDGAMDPCSQASSMEACHAGMHNETMEQHHAATHNGTMGDHGSMGGMGRR